MAIVVRALIAGLLSRCPAEWRPTRAGALAALAAAVFAFLDALDALLCLAFALVDGVLEDSPAACCCRRRRSPADADDEGVSDTLYLRRSFCRDALLRLVGTAAAALRRWFVTGGGGNAPAPAPGEKNSPPPPRWSDCGCDACTAWQKKKPAGAGDDDDHHEGRPLTLHSVAVHDPPPAHEKDADAAMEEEEEHAAAVFIHGFTSSSAFWTETVFPQLRHRRLLAVDLLGFGASPKPSDCAYTLRDHVSAIERSLDPSSSSSFHLVAHSMGCLVALAMAAKHPDRVKSLTLVAPPYFQSGGDGRRPVAEKKLWPPLQFGAAVMTWHEHIGRAVCFVVCKHHRLWEALLLCVSNLLPSATASRTSRLLRDLTRHTHRSAWRTMHNVVCGGAMAVERGLGAMAAAAMPVRVVHGGDDRVVPVECARQLKSRLPRAELRVLDGCDHRTVVFGREQEFAAELGAFWEGCEKKDPLVCM